MSSFDYIAVLAAVNAAMWGILIKILFHWASKIEKFIDELRQSQVAFVENMARHYVLKENCRAEMDRIWVKLENLDKGPL